jgi:cell division protein FtsI/penicillin-binding protein 2
VAQGERVPTGPNARGRGAYLVPADLARRFRPSAEVHAQEAADTAVAGVAQPAALVAIRISCGGVIASAIGPDPGGYNIAFLGEHPPGSTFKVVSAVALLEQGERPTDAISCPAAITIDGRQFHNAEHEAAGAFAQLSARIPGPILRDTARTLGIGIPLQVGQPAFAGVVPPPTDRVDLAAEAFGQGRILVSPVVMASLAAAVARGQWRPRTCSRPPSQVPQRGRPFLWACLRRCTN